MKLRTLTISELNGYISKFIKGDPILQGVYVEGEVSNLKFHSSGNVYFALKDDYSKINCMIFKDNQSFDKTVQEGDKVICKGKVNFYDKDGSITLIVTSLEKRGLGELYRQFLELKVRLEKEGLFDIGLKKPIPQMATKIGVVSSSTGAVIRDIYNVIKNRFPKVEIILYPSAVQGEGAADELVSGIEFFNGVKKSERVEIIILARGGGSYEELMPFNNENLAYSIFKSKIPIISAVGHETDFTIADFVADYRASTPSMAAELAVPKLSNIIQDLESKLNAINREMHNKTMFYQENLNSLKMQLNHIIESKFLNHETVLESKRNQLILLNPLQLLERGYASVYTEDQKSITRASELKLNETVNIRFFDGKVKAKIIGEKDEI